MEEERTAETLAKIQQTVREIFLVIDEMAKKAGVPYYLFYGSALGAVRHQGFIPWDDDGDIVMFREDYEQLRAYWLGHPVEGYFFQDEQTDPGYNLRITKIRKDNTAFVEPSVKDRHMHHGFFVDIFVLDDYVKNGFLRRVGELISLCDFNAVRGYCPPSGLAKAVYSVTNRLFKGRGLCKFWFKKIYPRLKKDPALCTDLASPSFRKSYNYRREWFGKPRYVKFDQYLLPIPQNAEATLTEGYGDFMTPPPPEQQQGHHHFFKLSFTEGYQP